MKLRRATTFGLALLGGAALASCGGEVQSEDTAGNSTPSAAATQATFPEAPAQDAPALMESSPDRPVATSGPPATTPEASPTRPRMRPAAPPALAATTQATTESATAASDPVAPDQAGEVRALEAGRTLELRVEAELSTKVTKAGDEFTATATDDVLGDGGEVLLPMGTEFKGRVVESRESTGSDQPAVLALEMASVTVNGALRPLQATVVDLEVKVEARDSGTRTAAKVGVGAAAGALMGRILGRDRDATIKGAVAGAAAGGAVAALTKDGHATVAAGARLVIRLDERLILQ